jgi:hypothetical protein
VKRQIHWAELAEPKKTTPQLCGSVTVWLIISAMKTKPGISSRDLNRKPFTILSG